MYDRREKNINLITFRPSLLCAHPVIPTVRVPGPAIPPESRFREKSHKFKKLSVWPVIYYCTPERLYNVNPSFADMYSFILALPLSTLPLCRAESAT